MLVNLPVTSTTLRRFELKDKDYAKQRKLQDIDCFKNFRHGEGERFQYPFASLTFDYKDYRNDTMSWGVSMV